MKVCGSSPVHEHCFTNHKLAMIFSNLINSWFSPIPTCDYIRQDNVAMCLVISRAQSVHNLFSRNSEHHRTETAHLNACCVISCEISLYHCRVATFRLGRSWCLGLKPGENGDLSGVQCLRSHPLEYLFSSG